MASTPPTERVATASTTSLPTSTTNDSTAKAAIAISTTTNTSAPAPAPATPSIPSASKFNPWTPSFLLVITSIYLAFFLIALDRMIIATAVPAITNSFDSISDIGWYGSAYMLTCAIFNPLFGSIYRYYDTKWTFIASVVVFEAGSAVCGAAPSSASFIVGRAVAGIGAAGITCGAIMIVVGLVPLHKRPVYTSFFGMAFGVSSVLGPVVGGIFTDTASLTWRWCFYINLPIGAFTLLVIYFFLHLPPAPPQKIAASKLPLPTKAKRLDPLGLFFFVPSIICLILALQWGGTFDSWYSPKIIGLLTTFAVLFIAFLAVEYTFPETAMAPPRVVLNRSVGSSMFFTFMSSGSMMSAIYYLAIWFQAAQGVSAKEAGIRMIPMVLSLVLFGVVMAVVTQRIGYYVPALIISPLLAAPGVGLLSTLNPGSSRAEWIGYQVLYGFGVGAGAQSASLAAQTVLEPQDVPLGTAMNFFMQQLGGAVFVPVAQNIFARGLLEKLDGVVGLDTTAILSTGATDLRKLVPAAELGIVVDAYSYASTRVFILGAALTATMIIGALGVEWKSIKKVKPAVGMKMEEEKGTARVRK